MGDGIEDADDVARLPDRPRFSLIARGDPIDKSNGLWGHSNTHDADPDDHMVRLPTGRDEDGEGVHGTKAHGGVFDRGSDSFDRIYRPADGSSDHLVGTADGALIPPIPPHVQDEVGDCLPPKPLLPPELGARGLHP